jgi:uncharacterized protein YkwD
MNYPSLFGIFAFVIFLLVVYSCTVEYNITNNYNYKAVESWDLNPNERELVRLINEHRINIGLQPLIPELLANKVCLDRNLSDIEGGLFPNHDGWYEMIQDSKAKDGSQVIGYNFTTPLSLFNAYLTSQEGHKHALENPNRTHIGVSFIQRRNYIVLLNY